MASTQLGAFSRTLVLLATFVIAVKCQDELNLPPTFFAPIAVFTPNEEQPAGTAIGTVVAVDFDAGDVVRYYIGSGTINANNFDVNETTGVVSFERQLDREALAPTNEPLLLFIRATDDRDHGTPDPQLEIRVFLRDINDNSPQFTNLPRTVTFRENTNEGATVLNVVVTDRDTGANAQLQYAIESIDGESCTDDCRFSIRQSSGIVTLERSLDFETARQHTISILVQDRGVSPNQVVQVLTVAVADVNDQNPAFQLNDYFAEVHENLTFDSFVTQVTAVDQDFGVNDDVTYEIISGNLGLDGVESFAINNETGVIYVNTNTLDRETYQQYTLTVMASEVNDPTKTDTTRVHITVFDINDHSPIFAESAYIANVSESQPLQSVLVTVTAMDRDFGINADFQFELVNLLNSSVPLPFRIDHNQLSGEGRIVLIDELDYEIQTLYIFQVIATEVIDNLPQNGSTIVSVSVINENDNAPIFVNQSYSATIPENAPAGIFVVMVRAVDDDIGNFGEVEYSFQDIVLDFNISATIGSVVTAMELDYEMQSQYVLSIMANDLDPELSRQDTVQLIVNLENLNDNPPQFVNNQVEIDTLVVMAPEEVAPPLIVHTFEVLDLDGDLNEHMFEIVEGNLLGHFEIEGAQLRTTVALNYDLRTSGTQSYELVVSVNDTEQVDFLQVSVLVLDINDNDPVFDNETYNFSVLENEEVDTIIGEVFAEDIDSGTFGEILYSISGLGSENFEINATSGVISTSSLLDREVRAEPFNLLVTATDQDESVANRNQFSVPLVITVLDENDNTPVFGESTYIFEVEENTDFIEFRVSATDSDISSNGEIVYGVVDGNVESTFLIGERSGLITRNSSVYLDRERVSQYILNVSATDRGEPYNVATVEVIINILDVNDVIPTFTQTEYNATIREDISTNSIVTDELMAFDNDDNEFGQVTYSIVSVTAPMELTGSFVIAPSTGVVRTTGTFDREVFPGPYTIMVLGRDGGFPVSNNGTTTLLVYIEDANDNRPIFSPTSYRQSVEEELSVGQPITIVSAMDADQQDTPNSEIVFSITDILGFDTTDNVMDHFLIDPASGEIFTNVSLDYESVRSYRITVEASDVGEPQRSSNAFVTVTVLDVNDHVPELSLDLYELTITEDTSVNTRFTLITATDNDDTSNAQIVYSIDITSPFRIDPTNGELILINSLDFESVTNYTFNVRATDGGGLYDDGTVRVMVVDVNDHRPVFERELYTATIEEGDYSLVPMSLLSVRTTDEDSGRLGTVNYTIVPTSDTFAINTLSNGLGQVIVTNQLDRETTDFYRITIVARDGGVTPESATATVEITVRDVNDIVPTLDRTEYSVAIQENSIPGDIIALVQATDNDAGENGQVLFSFKEGSTSGFMIDELTGEISASVSFDFEQEQSYLLTILAMDNSTSSPLSSTARFIVNITDMNDNAPIFDVFPADRTLSEATAVGTVIASVGASDRDSGDNAAIIYQLSNDEGKFGISSSGVITLNSSLDREIAGDYNLTVTAFDRGQPQMSVTGYLLVTVSDENDVVPAFLSDTYNFLVSEDVAVMTTVGTVLADDSDLGANGNILFQLLEGDSTVFQVNTVPVVGPSGTQRFAGVLVNRRVFDYESVTSYSLLIQAINTAFPRREAVVNVTVTVRDTNDNTPRFSMPGGYERSVSESATVGTPVGTVVATDNDGGLNGTVTYSIGNSTPAADRDVFSINNQTGVISVAAPLNFESRSQYNLIVMATDNAPVDTRRNASVNVRVNVLDFNERGPEFSQNIYYGSIDENLSAGARVITVNATEGDGGSVAYELVAGDFNKFAVDPVTGLVTTRQSLDREDQNRYILTVQARDTPGTNALSSFAQVEVTVMDVNDNSPEFSQDQYEFSLREHSPSGEALPIVTATDRDVGSNAMLTYSLSTGAGEFTVNSATGEITVATPSALDRETTPTITIRLTATDNGGTRLASTVPITVVLTNINDFSPVFSLPAYSESVLENSQAGVSILTVNATDGDGDTVTYAIASGDDPAPNNKFTVNAETGLIETTSNVLDRESLVARDFTYTLFIEGTDNGGSMGDTSRSTIVPVTITVMDVNDISPQCPSAPTSFMVAEANTLDVRIGQITATDGDSGTNALVNYRIAAGDIGGQFRIATTTGDLFALPGLDFESTPEYNLRIAAFDQAPDPANRRTSTCMVTVILSDENDNRPVFDLPLYEANVVENATIGHIVTVVSATDDDSGSNGDITYSFQSSVQAFSIDRGTGVITVSGSLDSETLDRYQLDVEATDGGVPRRIGVTQIAILVVNVNDNSPRFDRSFYSEEVSEDASVDTTIITITASDSDSPSLTYAIGGGNDDGYFKINTMNGVIQTARDLDREQVAVFDLLVEARDEDSNQGTTRLQVTVNDVNDEAPEFLQPSYFARVTENSPRGTQIIPEINMTTIRIEAIDSDEPNTQNSRVLYRLAGENSDLFSINFDTGIITVARGAQLDYETLPEIIISVVASDSVPVPDTQSSSVELRIQVLDENDNPPVFSQRFGYVIPVDEDHQVDTVISSEIEANDPDTGLGGEVRYSLSNANPPEALEWFGINRTSGDLLLTETLDRESYSVITLMVTGSDQGVPPLSSIVSVQIAVGDVNDNAPRFSQNVYTASVPEFLATGASATRVSAEDPDVGSNGEVEYSLLTTTEPFTINPVTGEVTTTGPLDHETQSSHLLTVQACDNGDMQQCDDAMVIINVQDFNDETPQFDLAEYVVDICDTSLSGQPLVQPIATDQDSGSNAQLTYMLQNAEQWGLFAVNSTTGLVYLTRDVDDLDVLNGRHEFNIVATDDGDRSLSGSARVVIRVLNCTEQQFTYSSPYFYFEIREGETQFTDGSTGQVIGPTPAPERAAFYPVDFPQNPFSINLNLLSLKPIRDLQAIGLLNGLDRETRDLYTVVVRAERQSEITFASVAVRVLDTNDNGPVFQSELYVFNVFENSTQTSVVGNVMAEDRDEGANAVVSYILLGVSPPGQMDPFTVNSSTGVITKDFDLDREAVDEYTLTIQATDGLMTNNTRVVVNVMDINDCTPTFSQSSYDEPVLENLPAGVVVTTVTVTDCDTGSNAVIRYAIVAGDLSVFEVDLVSGEITTLVVLDYETVSNYYLRIRATDMGSPTLFSEVEVNIQVVDFNDCPPEFIEPPPSYTIREDAITGSVVVDFNVNDCDSGLNGVNGSRFSIIAGNEEGRFDIIEESGVLFTTASLDRELRSSYLLSIQARDSATANRLSSVIQLNVIVDDVNDNDPVFIEPEISITVGEGEDLSEVLVQGRLANDADSGINGQITYSLLSDEGVFSIDANTGVITLARSLDRETRDSYELTVIARDRAVEPRSSNATIFVTVRDENDNAPIILNITSGVTMVSVEEGADSGTLVYSVSATDADDGSNGEISFSLNDPSLPFDISPSGGAIIVAGSLDYETRFEYTLVVVATDRGSPQPLSSLARLTVRITDRNDNPPMFDQRAYTGNQDENTPAGTTILSVSASDNDQTGSINAEVQYSLIGGDVDYFSVDPQLGVISNQVVLDRERQSSFSLTVLANNSFSSIPLTSTTTVSITVSDVNDEYPQFQDTGYEITLSESDPPNTRVVDVNATDGDQAGSPNSDLIYSINVMTNVGNLFHIDPDTGLITLQNSLDHETRPSFALEVIAEDKGSEPLRNTTIVIVNVTDANDIVPMFTESSYSISVREGLTTLPETITNLRYSDDDSTEAFRRSRFAITSVRGPDGETVDPNLFSVSTNADDRSGGVTLNNPVDYEEYTSYRVSLSVTNDEDLSSSLCAPNEIPCRLSNIATLDVLVVDENDEAPEFLQPDYSGEVSSTAPPDTSILSVRAVDDDRSPEFSTVKYRLDDESLREGKFRIDENTGILFTRIGFEEDVGLSYSLTVTAFDNDGEDPSLNNDALIRLLVLDNFQRVAIVFRTSLTTIINKQSFIEQLLEDLSGLDVVVEQYASYSNETHTQFIFHAIDSNNKIVGFNEFLQRVGDNNYDIIFERLKDCNITTIMSFATLTVYGVPPLLDRETIVILVFCLLLILGAIVLLTMALRQRYVSWTQERLKEGALATNHLFGPGGFEQGHYHTEGVEEQYELMQKGDFLNPMYVVPVSDPMVDLETSAAGSTTGLSSMHKNNPLYESQEISMDMFKEPDYDEEEDDIDDDGTDALAAVLDEEEDGVGDGGEAAAEDSDEEDIERTMI